MLLNDLKLAQTTLLILDAGGDQPFDIGKETSVGLANMKARKNAFLLFGTTPGKAIAPSGLFGRFLREALRQPSIGLDTLASFVRAKVDEASSKQQVPWVAIGSRTAADTILHTAGSRPSGPGKPATRELQWDEIRGQLELLNRLLSIRRSTRNENRIVSLAKLDAEYGPARKDAAQAAKKTSSRRLHSIWPVRLKCGLWPQKSKGDTRRSATNSKRSSKTPQEILIRGRWNP